MQKIEVGNEEFIYKKGPKGLVAHLALLLGIPEKRVKVVGLGTMEGEIYGEHVGTGDYKGETQKKGATWSSFLQWATSKDAVKTAEFVIDSRDGEDMQQLLEAEEELPGLVEQARSLDSVIDVSADTSHLRICWR